MNFTEWTNNQKKKKYNSNTTASSVSASDNEKERKNKSNSKQRVPSFSEWVNAERDDDEDIAPVVTSKNGKKTEYVGWSDDEIKAIEAGKGKNKELFGGFLQEGPLSDGYQRGDVALGILGSVGDFGLSAVKGVGRMAEGVGDLGYYGISGVAGLVGADGAQKYFKEEAKRNYVDEYTAPVSDWINQYSVFGSKMDAVGEGLGQVAATILTGGAAGATSGSTAVATAVTTGLTGLSSTGSGMTEAYNEGATDGEALVYGLSKGAIDAGTELIFGGLGKGVKALGVSRGIGGLDDMFAKKVSSKVVKHIANPKVQRLLGNTIEVSIKAGGEGLEEVLAGAGSAVMKKLTYCSDEELSQLMADEDLLDQFIVGAIVSGVAQGGDLYKSVKTDTDLVTDFTSTEEKVIDSVYQKEISEREASGEHLSKRDKSKLYDDVVKRAEKGYIDVDTIEEIVGGDSYTSYKKAYDENASLRKERDGLNNIKASDLTGKQSDRLAELKAMNLDDTSKTDGMKKQVSDDVFNFLASERKGQGSKLLESYREVERRGQAFTADLSQYKGKKREAIERAINSGVLNNTNRSHELVDILSNIEADKGIVFDYTNNQKLKETGFAIGGKTINGYVKDGAVTLNMQSQKAWESTVGHEITHVLEGTDAYGELQKALFTYAESRGELEVRRKELTELYKGIDADIDGELTAELIGDYLFKDKNFIKHISSNRNLFKRLYDEVKYLWNIATGKEKAQIEKVKREFDKAWKEIGKANVKSEGTKLSVSEDSEGNELSLAVQKRFANSKAVDENGNLKVLYHGTAAGEFYTFDKSKGSVEGDFGSGFYFTDNESDVKANYEDGGADFENKVARRAEQIEQEEDIDYSEAEARAREELYKGGFKHTVYLNIENPAIVGETNLFDYESYAEEYDRDDYDSDEDYEGDVEQLIADDIDQIVWDIEQNVDIYSTDGIADVLWNAVNEGGIGIEQLKAQINELYLEDNNGNLVGNEVTRQIIESLGYDGIIDNTVSSKFNMNLDEGTTHYIVFKPNQIKSIDNQNPTDNPDIRYSISEKTLDNSQNLTYNDMRGEAYVRTDENIGNGVGGLQGRMAADDSGRRQNSGRSIGLSKFVRLNPKTQEALSKSGVVGLELIDSSDDGIAFSNALTEARTLDEKNGWAVTPKTAEELTENKVRTIMTTDNKAGLGVAPDGDIEAVFKNPNGGQKRVLDTLIPAALEMGGNKLDCYGTGLVRLYAKYGFVPVARLSFNAEFANEGWTPDKGKPDIFFMLHNGDSADTVVENKGKYKQWTEEELDALPLFDKDAYDDAYAYRDNMIPHDIAPVKNSLSNNGEQVSTKGTPLKDMYFEQGIAPIREDVTENASDMPYGDVAPVSTEEIQAHKGEVDSILSGDTEENSAVENAASIAEEATFPSYSQDMYNRAQRFNKERFDNLSDEDAPPIFDEIPPMTEEEANTIQDEKVNAHSTTSLEAIQVQIENLREERADSLARFEQKIANKQAELNSKKNTETKVANKLRMQIEDLKQRRDSIDADYAKRISDAETKEKLVREGKPTTRQAHHNNIMNNMKAVFNSNGYDLDNVLRKAKDLSTFSTVDNTPQRVMEKALGYKEGQILSDLTVNKVAQNESNGIRWLNYFTDRKSGVLAQISKQYGIKSGSKESAAAQMYAEGFYVAENGDIIAYGDAELAKDFPNLNVRNNIKGLARDKRIRQIYDMTLDLINASRTRNAYPEIQKLDNYFLHFRAMEDTFSQLGLPFNPNDIRAKDLPTDLNGVTADLKPGQPYFSSAMHREGKRTSFDLLGGLERYLTSAKNQIYHIDDIQTLRALRNYIADYYGQAKGLESIDMLTEEEAQEKIKEVYGAHLSTFAKFLNEEANVLAGKTTLIDRGLEGVIGRRGITFLDTVNKQVGSNMVGYSASSAIVNFDAIPRAIAKSNKFDFLKAFTQTVSNKFNSIRGKSDGFADSSPVIIRRKGAERFYRTPFQKASDFGYKLMGAVDDISTEIIARTKFNELTRKGMSEQQAHFETDKWVSRLMGDRSLGQMPQLYNSKMLGLFTKFQLEVRNNLDSQFYDTIQEAKVSNEQIESRLVRNAKTAAKITSTLVQLAVAQHLFGKAFEAIAGYNPSFDIISTLATMFGFDDEEDSEDTALDNLEQGFLELLEDLPYTSTFTGGRIPIASALPITELITGTDSYGNEKSRWETIKEAAPYYILPGGYGQIKKTVQGLGMFNVDEEHPVKGSYTDSGKLRYPVEDTFMNRVQAGLFGQYANENAREYFDNGYDALSKKQIQEYQDVDLPIGDYWKYRKGLKGLKTLNEKGDYIGGLDFPVDKKNILINNIADRTTPIDFTGYEDYANFEEFDFATRYPEKYAVLKEQGISVAEYKEKYQESTFLYTDAFSWAANNPESYAVSKAVTNNVTKYKQYTTDLYNIKADKDANGKSINGSRKAKVIDYINNLNVDYEAKLILYKSEYPSDDTYNVEIIEYINARDDLTYDERVAIFTELGFVVKDGSVYW